MNLFSGLRADLSWLWLGYLGRAITYFGITVVLGRALGTEGYGQLAIFLGMTLGVSQLAGSWPFLSMPVLHARGWSIPAVFRPATQVAAATTLLALLIVLPLAQLIGSGGILGLMAILVYSTALVGMQGMYGAFQTARKMAGIAISQTLERGVTLLVLVGATSFLTLGLVQAQVILAASSLLVFICVLVFFNHRYGLIHLESNEKPAARSSVLSTVGAMGVVSVCAYGVAWVDIFMVDAFESKSAVGSYTLAYQVFTFVIQIGSLWAVATLPRHSDASAEGVRLIDQIPHMASRAVGMVWAGLMSVGAVLVVLMLPLVYGSGFAVAAAPLAMLLAAAAVSLPYYLITPAMVASGNARALAAISVAGLAVNFCVNLALIPIVGPVGAAIGTLVQSMLVTGLVVSFVFDRADSSSLLAPTLPALLALVILATKPGTAASLLVAMLVGSGTILVGGFRLRKASRKT